MSETAKVFEDRRSPGDWRVEWIDDDGRIEVAIFSRPNARERALLFANCQYVIFEEITLARIPRPSRGEDNLKTENFGIFQNKVKLLPVTNYILTVLESCQQRV